MVFNKVKIVKGFGGWGGLLIIELIEKKNKVVYVIGGVKLEIVVKIVEFIGCELIDGFL